MRTKNLAAILLLVILQFLNAVSEDVGALNNISFSQGSGKILQSFDCLDYESARAYAEEYCRANIILSFNRKKRTCYVQNLFFSGPAVENIDVVTFMEVNIQLVL